MEERTLNHKIYGEGDTIIIAHGLFGMLDNWQIFARQLAEYYQVITVDLRNHGRSFHDDDMSYTAMANDVIELMKALNVEKATLIGHSMGGKMAAQLALMAPEIVDALIVIDILPLYYERNHDMVLDALTKVDLTHATSRTEVENQMIDYLNGNKGLAFFLLKNLKRKKEGGFDWRFNLPVLLSSYDTIRDGIMGLPFEGATLFIKGGLSSYIGQDRWLKTTDLFPNAFLVEIPNAGHWVHVDKGEELLNEILSFLDERL
jgi:pimeloyl-ACP methyl ester carboxylesterase